MVIEQSNETCICDRFNITSRKIFRHLYLASHTHECTQDHAVPGQTNITIALDQLEGPRCKNKSGQQDNRMQRPGEIRGLGAS